MKTVLNLPSRMESINLIRESLEVHLDRSAVSKKDKSVNSQKKTIIIVTQDWSGEGWATLAQGRGDNVIVAFCPKEGEEKIKEFNLVGNGMFKKIPLERAIKDQSYKDAYFIFDQNHLSEQSEKLRKIGRKVFGASELSERMENDRKFAADVAKKYGLEPPPTFNFKDIKAGQDFLLKNSNKAYVFKPDGSDKAHLTFVPGAEKDKEANQELYKYLTNLNEGTDSFILQERKKGVEVNFEAWFYKGKPFIAFCCLENKRKLNKDLGENVGCAQDITFVVPLESRGVKETIGKLFPFYAKENYTGFGDVNVIIAENKIWFLEVCNRFGYNSHPNLFQALALDTFNNIMTDFINGRIDNFSKRFKNGFGSSISLYVDHPRAGIPITIKEEVIKSFYPYELYKEGNDYFLAGYDKNVGIICNHDYTIEDSAEGCFNKIYMTDSIGFPDLAMRSDLHKADYPSAPVKRYRALQSMKFVY